MRVRDRLKTLWQKAGTTLFGVDQDFKTFKTQQVFDRIYRRKIWGQDSQGRPTSGDGSHQSVFYTPYIKALKALLAAQNDKVTLADLGCGDFNIGQQFAADAAHIFACDISEIILSRNKARFEFSNVTFLHLDLAKDALPKSDIACVRQVLQHLGNAEISAFVARLNACKPYSSMVVTEHMSTDPDFKANVDKPTGPSSRVRLKSGVDLALPPFNLEFKSKAVLLEIEAPSEGWPAILRTTHYTF